MRVRRAAGNRTRRVKTPVWDRARELVVNRSSPCGVYAGPIDPGANYFVLMLEQLGANTRYSCEGHPDNFYVLFDAPVELAERIVECGYFTVELEGKRLWSVRTHGFSSDDERITVLRKAAEAWEKKLGPLDALKPRTNA